MTQQHIKSFTVKPSKIQDDDRWYSNGKYYVGTVVGENDVYLRNDGVVCSKMQMSATDPQGTYFLTQQDAQDCLDRYNAAQLQTHQDTQT